MVDRRTVVGQLRQVRPYVVAEPQRAVERQQQDARGRELLGDRADVEDGVRGNRDPVVEIREAVPPRVEDVAAPCDPRPRSRERWPPPAHRRASRPVLRSRGARGRRYAVTAAISRAVAAATQLFIFIGLPRSDSSEYQSMRLTRLRLASGRGLSSLPTAIDSTVAL